MTISFPTLDKSLLVELRAIGFEAINQESLSTVNRLLHKLITQKLREFLIANSTSKSNIADKESELSKFENDLTLGDLSSYREQIKPEFQKWYQIKRQQLNSVCRSILVTAKDAKEIEAVYKNWHGQAYYKFYRSKSLLFIYQKIMSTLKDWLDYAYLEFEMKHHLLNTRAKIYLNYLNQVKKFIDDHTKAIRTSMLTRLESGTANNDISFDDVTVATITKLESLGALSKTELPVFSQQGMTPKTFGNFIKILQENGIENERQALKKLCWFKTTETVTYQPFVVISNRSKKNQYYLVPTICIDTLPKKLPFYLKLPKLFHNLFKGIKLRYEYFQNDNTQYLLAAQTTINKLTVPQNIDLLNLHKNPFIHDIHYFESLLLKEQERKNLAMRKISGRYYKKEQKLHSNYQQYLQIIGKTLLNKKVDLLEAIVHRYENSHVVLSSDQKTSLCLLLEEIQNGQMQWGPTDRFMNLQTRCQHYLLIHRESQATVVEKTTDIQAQPILVATDERPFIKKFNQGIYNAPLPLEQANIPNYLQELEGRLNLIKASKSIAINDKSLKIRLYKYTLNFINIIFSLGSKTDLINNLEHIKMINATLRLLGQSDQVYIKNVIEKLTCAINDIDSLSWTEIVDIKLKEIKTNLLNMLPGHLATKRQQNKNEDSNTRQIPHITSFFSNHSNYTNRNQESFSEKYRFHVVTEPKKIKVKEFSNVKISPIQQVVVY